MRELTSTTGQLLKPTATIHVGNRLSLIERKLFNAIIWHSQKNRFAKNANSVSVGLLMSLIGFERSKNMDVIKDALVRLTTNPIIWNTLKKDRTADFAYRARPRRRVGALGFGVGSRVSADTAAARSRSDFWRNPLI